MPFKISQSLQKYIAFLLLTFLVCLSFWKVATFQGIIITDDIFASDLMNKLFPCRFFLSNSLKEGNIPLWSEYVYTGFPFLAHPQSAVFYPLNIILFGLFSPWVALNLTIIIHIILLGFFTFLYARLIKIKFIPSLISSTALIFSGFFISHIKHLCITSSAIWFILSIFFAEQGIQNRQLKYFFYSGIIFGIQNLGGHPQISYISILGVFIYIFIRAIQSKVILKNLLGFFIILFIGGGLSAIQLIPTYELTLLTQRKEGAPFAFSSDFPYSIKNLLTFIFPYINGNPGKNTYQGVGFFWEDYAYVGLIPLIFAIISLKTIRKNPYTLSFLILIIISFILVLSPNFEYFKILYNYLPGIKFFRFQSRFLLIVDFSLSILAGIGLSYIFEKDKNRLKVNFIYLFLFIVTIIDLLYYQIRQNPIVNWELWTKPPSSINIFKNYNKKFRIFTLGGFESHKKAYNLAKGWEGDLTPYIMQREFLQPSTNTLYHIESGDGYMNLVPSYFVSIWGDPDNNGLILDEIALDDNDKVIIGNKFIPLLSLFNVRFILSLWPLEHPFLKGLKEEKPPFIYENLNVMPRAFSVSKFKVLKDENEALSYMKSEKFDYQNEVLLYKDPKVRLEKNSEKANIIITSYKSEEVKIKVSTKSNQILVLSDSYYPGWKGYLNGKEVEIYQVNIMQRGVFIPKGEHELIFKFEPISFRIGIIITCSTLFFILIIRFWRIS